MSDQNCQGDESKAQDATAIRHDDENANGDIRHSDELTFQLRQSDKIANDGICQSDETKNVPMKRPRGRPPKKGRAMTGAERQSAYALQKKWRDEDQEEENRLIRQRLVLVLMMVMKSPHSVREIIQDEKGNCRDKALGPDWLRAVKLVAPNLYENFVSLTKTMEE